MRCLPQEIRSVVACSSKQKLLDLDETDKAWATWEANKMVNATTDESKQNIHRQKTQSTNICKFHKRFGDNAKKCRPFCKFWVKKVYAVDDESLDFKQEKNL